jgi:hypothetical protein
MNSKSSLDLTATDRVLIHLRDYMHHADDKEFPQAMTQKGISEATGLRLTHIPRTLKGLEGRNFLGTAKSHVVGEKRRYNVYFLTQSGVEEANAVLRHLKGSTVCTSAGSASVGDILDSAKGPLLPVLRELAGEASAPPAKCGISGPVPDVTGFVDRDNELAELNAMLDDARIRVIAVYGSRGYGTSALASHFVRQVNKRWSAAWVEARKDLPGLLKAITDTATELKTDFDISARTPKKLAEQFCGSKIILVLDGYFGASEETVEFLTGFVSAIKAIPGFKLLVTVREDTPSYNRFYTIIDQHDGSVGEVHIRGLDIRHCQTILGTPDIDPDAMKRLFLFTRGKPPTLKLLARGNEKELRQNTSFSPEEIKLMLFLNKQKKE